MAKIRNKAETGTKAMTMEEYKKEQAAYRKRLERMKKKAAENKKWHGGNGGSVGKNIIRTIQFEPNFEGVNNMQLTRQLVDIASLDLFSEKASNIDMFDNDSYMFWTP